MTASTDPGASKICPECQGVDQCTCDPDAASFWAAVNATRASTELWSR